jgi:23S rRNA (cytidine1920-2'-O)/16S rRNA (cytidine1409-2'-O)-methyltransferase
MTGRKRLDSALKALGLLPSRARARDAILRGTVTVNGQPASKAGQQVRETDEIALADPAAGYVSRAALKLKAGLDAAGIAVNGRICLDVGLSTGGFAQVLLERGAARVYGVDVGHGQVHPSLKDSRLVVLEGLDARDVTSADVPQPVDLIVCDVSFVSVTKVLAAPLALCAPAADAVVLIKPQFEVGRPRVGKGGIVTDATAIAAAAADAIAFMARNGWLHLLSVPSPIRGAHGNQEILTLFHRQREPQAGGRYDPAPASRPV